MPTPKYFALGLCFALVGFANAAEEKKPEDAAQAVAESWLKETDAGKYAEAYEAAAALLKKAATKEEFTKSLTAAREPLGKLVSRKVKSRTYAETLPGAPDGKYVVVQFETVFEKKAAAIETVTPMQSADGAWRVSGYFIK